MLTTPPLSTLWQSLSYVWPAVGAVSELGLLVTAAFGLRQLKVAQDGLKQNRELAKLAARRDSYQLAAEQCRMFREIIMPKILEMRTELHSIGRGDELAKYSLVVVEGALRLNPPPPDLHGFFRGGQTIQRIIEAANGFETFALPFIARIADQEVAFISIGINYCDTLKRFALPIVPILGPHARALYVIWQGKIDRSTLLKQQEALAQELASKPDVKLRPIGT